MVQIFSKNENLIRKVLKSVLEIEINFGSEMKFEPRDFDFNELTNLERFKAFLNRKFGILLEDSKFKPTALTQGYFPKNGKQ
jgi:hypothetical protein